MFFLNGTHDVIGQAFPAQSADDKENILIHTCMQICKCVFFVQEFKYSGQFFIAFLLENLIY